ALQQAQTLAEAIAILRPIMGDFEGVEFDPGTLLLINWSQGKLTWGQLEAMPDSERTTLMQYPDSFRGVKLCSRGTVVQLDQDPSTTPPVHTGGLTTAAWGIVRFVALGSVTGVAPGQEGRVCGIFTGIQTYLDTSCGVSQADHVVGMFDVQENH